MWAFKKNPLSLPRKSLQHNVCLCVCSFRCRCRKLDVPTSQCKSKSYIERDSRKNETELRKDIAVLHWNLYMLDARVADFVSDSFPAGLMLCSDLPVLPCPVLFCPVLSCSVSVLSWVGWSRPSVLWHVDNRPSVPSKKEPAAQRLCVCVCVCSFRCRCRKLDFTGSQCNNK